MDPAFQHVRQRTGDNELALTELDAHLTDGRLRSLTRFQEHGELQSKLLPAAFWNDVALNVHNGAVRLLRSEANGIVDDEWCFVWKPDLLKYFPSDDAAPQAAQNQPEKPAKTGHPLKHDWVSRAGSVIADTQ